MSDGLWEIVQADELKVGDVIVDEIIFDDDDDFGFATIGEIRHGEIRVFYRYKNGGSEYSLSKKRCVFRRIPDADDPRVLMRALAIAELHNPSPFGTVKQWIEQARRELESEGNRDNS